MGNVEVESKAGSHSNFKKRTLSIAVPGEKRVQKGYMDLDNLRSLDGNSIHSGMFSTKSKGTTNASSKNRLPSIEPAVKKQFMTQDILS